MNPKEEPWEIEQRMLRRSSSRRLAVLQQGLIALAMCGSGLVGLFLGQKLLGTAFGVAGLAAIISLMGAGSELDPD